MKHKHKKRPPIAPKPRKPCVSRDGKVTICGAAVNPKHPPHRVAQVAHGEIICRACMEATVVIWGEMRHDDEWADMNRIFSVAL